MPWPQFVFEDRSQRLTAFLDSVDTKSKPGYAITVLRGEETLLEKFAGVESMPTGRPITAQTSFYVVSVGNLRRVR